jgi:hypothetical protein
MVGLRRAEAYLRSMLRVWIEVLTVLLPYLPLRCLISWYDGVELWLLMLL